MMRIVRCDATYKDFINLVRELDAGLAENYGDQHAFYDQYNKVDLIKHVVLVYKDDRAVACGAMKAFDECTMEIKRMYTALDYRGQGYAKGVLEALEEWALELGCDRCVLETGSKQIAALALYEKCHYKGIPNYGQYIGIETSFCFEKRLK